MTDGKFSKCYKCFRPLKSCYCKYITEIDTNVKFVFLMHPKEAYHQKTGTGRLSHLSLKNSEIIIGINFNENERLWELINNPDYYPVLLYPDENAWTAQKEGFAQEIGNRTLLVIVVDATWFCAKKMLKLSTRLKTLPKLSFKSGYRSQFTFKRQPAEECLSTIESCYYLIKELQNIGIANPEVSPEGLITVFKKMIEYQLESEKERIAQGLPCRHPNKKPKPLELAKEVIDITKPQEFF